MQLKKDSLSIGPLASTPRRLLVVINPVASSVSSRLRSLMVSALETRYDVHAVVTDGPGHAAALAGEAKNQGMDAVVAFGGDGTANEVANGLGDSDVPLTCLPGGSANVFCGVTGSPREITSAVRHLLGRADNWQSASVDAGTVNGRRFLFTSGVGLDAKIVAGVDSRPELKRRWRQWWFVTHAARVIASDYAFSPPRVRIVGQPGSEGIAAVVQNGRPWTYFGQRPITVSKDAGLNTGTLAVTVVGRPRPWDYLPIGVRVFSDRGAAGHSRIHSYSAADFTVEALDSALIDVHVDGDHIGSVSRANYSVEPGAIRLLV
ncbi:MAG: diacylglycerol kinase family protein [Solirubrobacterales bacterium]|nr:diacylglycerol kinase family protein [Solirubrobacterales bacterium]